MQKCIKAANIAKYSSIVYPEILKFSLGPDVIYLTGQSGGKKRKKEKTWIF